MLWKGFSLKNAKSVEKSPALGNSQGLNDEAGVQSTRTELTLTHEAAPRTMLSAWNWKAWILVAL